MKKIILLSLGGSLVVPRRINAGYLKKFVAFILKQSAHHRFIIVVGGGHITREYITAVRALGVTNNADLDQIGIAASRLNAQLVRSLFGRHAEPKIATDPLKLIKFKKSVLVAAGYRPGWSTDYVAVLFARKFGVKSIVNLTNISHVHTADPKKDNGVKTLSEIRWPQFRKLVGSRWTPGLHMPFDPIASKLAHKLGLEVVVADGKALPNLKKIIQKQKFKGTRIY